MVKVIILNNKKAYQCEDCKLMYNNRNDAEKCEKWCLKHHSCNITITKYAINKFELIIK